MMDRLSGFYSMPYWVWIYNDISAVHYVCFDISWSVGFVAKLFYVHTTNQKPSGTKNFLNITRQMFTEYLHVLYFKKKRLFKNEQFIYF